MYVGTRFVHIYVDYIKMYVMSISDINKKELENYSSRYFWKTGIHTRLSPKYEFK